MVKKVSNGENKVRKKQILIPFERSRSLVIIDPNDFYECAIKDSDNLGVNILLFDSLINASDLSEQIRLIQSLKGTIKSKVQSIQSVLSVNSIEIQNILLLYLLPKYFPLRNSLEWLPEVLVQGINKSDDTGIFRSAVCEGCQKVLDIAKSDFDEGEYRNLNERDKMEGSIGWIYSLNCLSSLDKDIKWFENDTLRIQFMCFVAQIFNFNSNYVIYFKNTDEPGGTEVLRYADCCCECLRAIVTVIKQFKSRNFGTLIPEDMNRAVNNTLLLLRSELVNKDVMTSAAMGALSIQWCLVGSEVRDDRINWMDRILSLLDCDQLTPKEVEEVVVRGLESNLLPNLVNGLAAAPSLGPIRKTAIIRACLALFDNSSLLYNSPPLSDTVVGERCGSPLFQTSYESILKACSSSEPQVRLYGFQTLETWLDRVDAIIQGMSKQLGDVFISEILQKYDSIVQVLTEAWSHPSRQVVQYYFSNNSTFIFTGEPYSSVCLSTADWKCWEAYPEDICIVVPIRETVDLDASPPQREVSIYRHLITSSRGNDSSPTARRPIGHFDRLYP